ncbi:UNVERIFIED_CONTAM: hypothetical protein FKN15_014708 [Acipenser sinensis]
MNRQAIDKLQGDIHHQIPVLHAVLFLPELQVSGSEQGLTPVHQPHSVPVLERPVSEAEHLQDLFQIPVDEGVDGKILRSLISWVQSQLVFGTSDGQMTCLFRKSWSTLLYQKQCEIRYPIRMILGPDPGITKEPSFISKKRVPHYRPQISRSFQWVHGGETPRHSAPRREAARCSVKTHAPVTEDQAAPERIRTPPGPRVPRLPRSQSLEPRPRSVPHSPLANGKSMPSLNTEKGGPAAQGNGVNRVLQKKAGLKTDMRRSVARSSEYQRQFMWKTPSENSPLLAAEQLVYNRNKEVPLFNSGSFVRESEYQRNFKSSPPPKGLRLRKDLEEQEAENISPVSNSKSEKNKTYSSLQNGHIDKDPQLAAEKPVLKQCDSEDPKLAAEKPVVKQCNSKDPKLAAEKLVLKQQNPQRLFFPHRGYGKMKSEYNSNFRSPVKYSYKDGAWIKGRVSSDEVKELREMAEAYKKRAQGTHFSREHLNQILSEKNRFWEVSSSLTLEESASDDIRALDLARTRVLKRSPSPARSGSCSPVQSDTSARKSPSNDTVKASLHSGATHPVRRRLAWENEHEEQETLRRSEGEQAQEEKEDEQEKEGRVVGQKLSAKSVSDITPVSSNLSNEDEGRLPTPEMKNQGGAPRTHHDLTTPTVVSPPKLKPSSKRDLQPEPPLGKPYSPHKYLPREFAERMSMKVDVDGQSRSSIAAGLKTSDPFPLREDSRLADSPPAALRTPSKSSNSTAPPNTGPASLSPHREAVSQIQGSLRDPEFQHNDDRMSQISARSAASSSLASLILERAQKRKHNFWGKS